MVVTYHRVYGKLFHKQKLLVFGINIQMLKHQFGQH